MFFLKKKSSGLFVASYRKIRNIHPEVLHGNEKKRNPPLSNALRFVGPLVWNMYILPQDRKSKQKRKIPPGDTRMSRTKEIKSTADPDLHPLMVGHQSDPFYLFRGPRNL